MRFFLFILSSFFNLITTIRNLLFDVGILKTKSYKTPVICVGNLSAGGSGKTPQINYIINLLKNEYNIAVLSRGYSRATKGFRYVNYDNSPKEVGDEALLIKQKHQDIVVAVEIKRTMGVEKIMNDYPNVNVILLDDGLQHRWIKAGFNILMTTYKKPFFNDYLLPFGTLRENTNALSRTDIVVMSKCPSNINPTVKKFITSKMHLFAHQNLYFSTIKYHKCTSIIDSNIITDIKNYSILLVTAISDATPVIEYLESQRCKVTHLRYVDHYHYTPLDIKKILNTYKKDKTRKKLILTTEKDAVKLNEFNSYFTNSNIYILPIETEFHNKKEFDNKILDYVRKNTGNSKISKEKNQF